MSTPVPVPIGVGFDTARYGHHVSFLRADRQPAAKPFTFAESPAGYAELRQALEQLQRKNENVHFCMRIDAAGQYAANLEQFPRALPYIVIPDSIVGSRKSHAAEVSCWSVALLAASRAGISEVPSTVRR
jgi:hypothetical protein